MKRIQRGFGLLGLLLVACGGSAKSRGDGDAAAGAAGELGAGGEIFGASGAAAGSSAQGGGAGSAGGGVSGSGAAAAGTSSMAEGGAGVEPVLPPLPLPLGCEPRTRDETETTCTLQAYCSSMPSQNASCQWQSSGRWRCQCAQQPGRTFEVGGAEGMAACAVAVGACGADEAALADEVCEADTSESSDLACRHSLVCRREVDVELAADARAWLVREGWAGCHRDAAEDPFECQCLYEGETPEYTLAPDSGSAACRALVPFCMSRAEPEFGDEEECVLSEGAGDAESCERWEECTRLMPLDEGVSLAQIREHHAACDALEGGGASCHCSAPGVASLGHEISGPPDAGACADAIAVCAADAEVVPAGAVTCEPQSLTTFGSTACNVDLSCHQAATLNGRALVAEGRLLVRCDRAEPGDAWLCSCASDQATERFLLGVSSASAWEACNQAPQACLEHLDVHLGAYGELVEPPDPLLP